MSREVPGATSRPPSIEPSKLKSKIGQLHRSPPVARNQVRYHVSYLPALRMLPGPTPAMTVTCCSRLMRSMDWLKFTLMWFFVLF